MKKIVAVSLLSSALLMSGCMSQNPYTGESQVAKSTSYGGIGALGGAVVGGLAGGKKGALIGAAVGGASGAGYGYYTDLQEKKLRQQLQGTGVEVQKQGQNLNLIIPGNVSFNTNDSNVSSNFYPALQSIVDVLKEYNTTTVNVVGHTDNTGNFEKNQVLSEARAKSVADYFVSQGVSSQRLHVYGVGPRQPIASNDTAAGRQTNRRVEITIIPAQQ